MHGYLDRLEHWEITSGIKFQILHLGWDNIRHKTKLGDEFLENSPAERDMEVLVARRANSIPEYIKHSWSKDAIILLHLALVQP